MPSLDTIYVMLPPTEASGYTKHRDIREFKALREDLLKNIGERS